MQAVWGRVWTGAGIFRASDPSGRKRVHVVFSWGLAAKPGKALPAFDKITPRLDADQ